MQLHLSSAWVLKFIKLKFYSCPSLGPQNVCDFQALPFPGLKVWSAWCHHSRHFTRFSFFTNTTFLQMTNTFVLIPFLLGPRISIFVNVQSSEQILWQPYLLLDTSHQLSSPLGGKVYHPQVLQLNSVIASTHVSSVSSVCGMMITGCIAAKDLRNIPVVPHGIQKTWT